MVLLRIWVGQTPPSVKGCYRAAPALPARTPRPRLWAAQGQPGRRTNTSTRQTLSCLTHIHTSFARHPTLERSQSLIKTDSRHHRGQGRRPAKPLRRSERRPHASQRRPSVTIRLTCHVSSPRGLWCSKKVPSIRILQHYFVFRFIVYF